MRPLLFLAPLVLAGSTLLVAPASVRAADGMTETGTTTYEVIPSKNVIAVTVTLSDYNGKPDTISNGNDYYYFRDATELAVEKEAGAVSVTSNVGSVFQTALSSDTYYRYIKLSYSPVYYGQTRVLTATYTIPAAPHALGGYRAGQAYAALCAVGNGVDTGSVSIVLPAGFDLYVDSGSDLPQTSTSGVKQVYSSGTQPNPYKFWTCVDAEDAANLTHQSLIAGGQAFDIQSWPEDASWKSAISQDVGADVQKLEDLTGLKMPGGTIQITEAGDQQLGDYGGVYDSATKTATIPETVLKDTVAHELSHIWFNRTTLADKWMSEGLAGFSEQAAGTGNYTACKAPDAYPGTGSPNLMSWMMLNRDSTTQDVNVSDWQYAASCYIFTTLAADMGPANFKAVLGAAAADEMPYQGSTVGEKMAGDSLPISSKRMLDLIDEFGLYPATVADLDKAQKLLASYGIFDTTELANRSTARAAYHTLATAAGTWKLPLAIRTPMTMWEFTDAGKAMATATQIITARDSIEKQLSGFTLDGTDIEKKFESAATQLDLDNLLTLIKKEADAAAKVDQATRLEDGNHSILQAIGLLGADVTTPLKQARTDLTAIKPDTAGNEAQTVIDRINGSNDQGLLRVGSVVGALLALLLLIGLIVFIRRRRHPAVVVGPDGGVAAAMVFPPGPVDPMSSAAPWGAQGAPPAGAPAPWGAPGDPSAGATPAWGQPAAWPPAPPQAVVPPPAPPVFLQWTAPMPPPPLPPAPAQPAQPAPAPEAPASQAAAPGYPAASSDAPAGPGTESPAS